MSSSTWGSAYITGLLLGLSLIVAIGAQNAFVLRQGLRREHVGTVVAVCALADAMLITAGVMGLGQWLGNQPFLAQALAWAGAVFLFVYGALALRRVRHAGRLQATAHGAPVGRGAVLAQTLAFTFLNPHVYLDAVVLMGGISAQQPPNLRGWFLVGACTASLAWFTTLGYGSRRLAPVFAQPRAWQVLDGLIGLTMWVLAALLVRHAMPSG